MKVLITNNHIIGNEELKQKSINFSYYDGFIRHLELNNSRRTFTKKDKDIDITIIEIKEKDKINHYLELDENFFQNKAQDFNSFREYRTVYNLFYSNQMSYISYGIIKNINEKQIYHSCSTEKGASGSPVCLLGSKKVIGIHVGGSNWESNISVSLKYGINEFLDYLNKNKNKNEQESIYYVPIQTDRNKNNLNNKNKNNACDTSFVSDNAEKTNHLKNNFNRHIILNEDLDELSYKQNVVFNYVRNICGCAGDWQMDSFIEDTVAGLRREIGDKGVVLGLSGGVDSSVAAALLSRAVGKQLTCVFVDQGLMRKDEGDLVEQTFTGMFDMNFRRINCQDAFLAKLKGITDP
mgnify:CR=1 FL=1